MSADHGHNTSGTPDSHGDHAAHPSYLHDGYDWRSWLLTVDHKRIGIM